MFDNTHFDERGQNFTTIAIGKKDKSYDEFYGQQRLYNESSLFYKLRPQNNDDSSKHKHQTPIADNQTKELT